MENHHAIHGKTHYKWWFSRVMWNYQRVPPRTVLRRAVPPRARGKETPPAIRKGASSHGFRTRPKTGQKLTTKDFLDANHSTFTWTCCLIMLDQGVSWVKSCQISSSENERWQRTPPSFRPWALTEEEQHPQHLEDIQVPPLSPSVTRLDRSFTLSIYPLVI